MDLPANVDIGALLLSDERLPLRADGEPYQVLFCLDDNAQVTGLALSSANEPLVWGTHDSDDPAEWTVEIAPPEIAEAAWAWARSLDR